MNHDDFADMNIDKPIEMKFKPHQVLHYDMVCKYSDLGPPWTGPKLATLIEGLGIAAEASAVMPKEGSESDYPLKEAVRHLIRLGHSMIDIPEMLGMDSLQEAAQSLCGSRTPTAMLGWNEADWLEFEADLQILGARTAATKWEISATLFARLRNLYQGEHGWFG
jgi:hypothetical protein